MLYCDPCRKYNDWPESISRSRGPCEICKNQALCFDRPSDSLPPSRAYREWEAKKLAELQLYGRVDTDIFDGVE